MNSGRLNAIGLLAWLLVVAFPSPAKAATDWLNISGEKGFSLAYFNGSNNYLSSADDWLTPGFSFSQSLTLEVTGEFSSGYTLEGRLVDQPNAPLQLFMGIKGENAGLQFGDGNLAAFSTALTEWSGEFNGLEAYLKNQRHLLKLAYANPTGIAYRENLVVESGRSCVYLTHLPIKEGTLKVFRDGAQLIEGVDYQLNYFNGKMELQFYVDNDTRLDLEYQYLPSEVLGNTFLAVNERTAWDNQWAGFEYFSSQTRKENEAVLLGETRQPNFFDLTGVSYGFQTNSWKWDFEYWQSAEVQGRSWNYIDNMEGTEMETEVFTGTTDPFKWYTGGCGSGYGKLDGVTWSQDPQHTREGESSLIWNYDLKRTGDTAYLFHDFGSYRDFSLLSHLNDWVYLNGQDLIFRVELITSENNYYYYEEILNGVGWNELEISLDSAKLQTMGVPALSRVRYLKFSLSSISGSSANGRLYLAPVTVTGKSDAAQRWSNIRTDPGSTATVSSEAEIVPGEGVDNRILKINGNFFTAAGWVKVTYEPSVMMDISSYRELKLWLNSSNPVTVGVIALRDGEEYQLGTVTVAAGGWREYSIDLGDIPTRILERLEALTLSLTGGGSWELKVDSIRVVGRSAPDATAVKARGEYQAGAWRSHTEIEELSPGFRDLDSSSNYHAENMRNITEYTGEKWRVRSDLRTYESEDAAKGYPLLGRRGTLEIGNDGTKITVTRVREEIAPSDPESGDRAETLLRLNQQWGDWNFDLERRAIDDLIGEDLVEHSDSATVKYRGNLWWLTTQLWRDEAAVDRVNSTKRGGNYGLGVNFNELSRLQLNGGQVTQNDATGTNRRNFWRSDLSYALTSWLRLNGLVKSVTDPDDAEGIISDLQSNLGLEITPRAGLNITLGRNRRDWTEAETGDIAQRTETIQTSYSWGAAQKITGFFQAEELEYDAAETFGSHYGISGDLNLAGQWLTQFTAEYDGNAGRTLLYESAEANYKFSVKNSLPRENIIFYWGGWTEGEDESDSWDRRLLQAGLEKQSPSLGRYGAKLDLGLETDAGITGVIWGTGWFIFRDRRPHCFQAALNYQTYTDYIWKASFDYRFSKNDSVSFNLHGDFFDYTSAKHNLIIRADLLFYLR